MYYTRGEITGMVMSLVAFAAILFGLFVLIASSDTSSWITYNDHGRECVTLYRSDNHAFSPDKNYTENWCK